MISQQLYRFQNLCWFYIQILDNKLAANIIRDLYLLKWMICYRQSVIILNDHPAAYRVHLIDRFVSRLHFIKDHCYLTESLAEGAVQGGG